MTRSCLSTYEKDNDYTSPTEVIDISKVKTIKSDEKDPTAFVNKFLLNNKRVETNDAVFLFRLKSLLEKENWIGSIGKAMVGQSGPSVFYDEEN